MSTYLLPSVLEGFCVQKIRLGAARASEGRADGLQQAWKHRYLTLTPYSCFFFMDLYEICCLYVSEACCSLVLRYPAICSGRAVLQTTLIAPNLLCHSFGSSL